MLVQPGLDHRGVPKVPERAVETIEKAVGWASRERVWGSRFDSAIAEEGDAVEEGVGESRCDPPAAKEGGSEGAEPSIEFTAELCMGLNRMSGGGSRGMSD